MPDTGIPEIKNNRPYHENPNQNAKIGFVVFYPFHFFVLKNVYTHLADESEFIVDLGTFFPVEQSPDIARDIVALLTRHGVRFRILYYDDYRSEDYLKEFFGCYEIMVSPWLRRGCLRLPVIRTKKKVHLTYGAGKDLATYGLWKKDYDLILAYGKRDHSIFSLYTWSEIVGNPKFDDWFNGTLDQKFIEEVTRKIDPNKRTVLYLPTHGDLSSLDELSDSIKKLTSEFNLIVKLHYYTVREEPERIEKIRSDSLLTFKDDIDLLPLFKIADVVISDNSSVIFDAILADKPLVLTDFLTKEYLDTTHKVERRYRRGTARALTYSGSIEQEIKKEGLVPIIKNPSELPHAIKESLQDKPLFREARKEIRENLFSFNDGNSGARAAAAIKKLQKSTVPEKPLLYHLVNEFEEERGYASREKLKGIVRADVLVTRNQQKIVSPNGMESGWLFDFRRGFLKPDTLDLFAEIFWRHLEDEYPFQVGGQETAALPLITAIMMKGLSMGKPVNGFYVRKSRKKEGLQNIIEGRLTEEKIILVDDLINTGTTFARLVDMLERVGKKPECVFALVRFRDLEYYSFFQSRNIRLITPLCVTDFGIPLVKDEKSPPLPAHFKIIWYFQSKDPNYFYVVPKSEPALDEHQLYFGSDSGSFWALSQDSGNVIWRYQIGSGRSADQFFSSPALDQRRVYFGGCDGNVYALDKEDGKLCWRFTEADWVDSSPVLAPERNLLFVGLRFGLVQKHGGVAALDLDTGVKRWELRLPQFTYSSPTYSPEQGVVGIGCDDRHLYMLEASDGELRWMFEAGGEMRGSPAFDPQTNLVFFGSLDGVLYGLDIETGTPEIEYRTGHGIYSTPLVWNGRVIFSSLDKKLYCLDPTNSRLIWEFSADRRIFASPVVIEDKIYIGANDGRMYELNADTGKMTAFFQTTERITNRIRHNPRTKRFFVTTYANEIYCLEKNFLTNAPQ